MFKTKKTKLRERVSLVMFFIIKIQSEVKEANLSVNKRVDGWTHAIMKVYFIDHFVLTLAENESHGYYICIYDWLMKVVSHI